MGYFTCVMSTETGNLCNKCPKWLVKQNSSYSDYFNVISGFTSNSRAPGGPVAECMHVNQWFEFLDNEIFVDGFFWSGIDLQSPMRPCDNNT